MERRAGDNRHNLNAPHRWTQGQRPEGPGLVEGHRQARGPPRGEPAHPQGAPTIQPRESRGDRHPNQRRRSRRRHNNPRQNHDTRTGDNWRALRDRTKRLHRTIHEHRRPRDSTKHRDSEQHSDHRIPNRPRKTSHRQPHREERRDNRLEPIRPQRPQANIR
jgi:hypothetical protein